MVKKIFCLLLSVATGATLNAQPVLSTGPGMPNKWIDADTHHKIVRLTNNERSNLSFYFHNNPFTGNKMVFYSTEKTVDAAAKQETYNSNARDRQLYILDLKTLQSERLTNQSSPITGEIVSTQRNEAFYQVKDSVFAVNLSTKKTRLVYTFPDDFKAASLPLMQMEPCWQELK
ncbi:oligogalacturonate lyase family protein [Niabella hibiscisoli]|uniref:oligogalacturonate lyase family protein n=1 Tax=Niabella hibiscisoli TaxID=1825928 RepID=UPI001F0E5D62|nr:oligogalacturonate lyase family protein [Niabella hibiscisoli]MCH5718348.1 oligogalacturonate lyase family protein [Niabella hibiscisoli]